MLVALSDADAIARAAADLIHESISAGGSTLGLATGSTPLGTYTELARRISQRSLSLSSCRGFLLDEYVGLPATSAQSFRSVIRRDFVEHVDLPDVHVFGPDGGAEDLQAEAQRYEAAVRDARVDVQLLGLGANGHIGFNEPGSALDSRTRVVTLTEQTRGDNARFFDDLEAVPRQAITQGLTTICAAQRIVLLVLGERKAEALRDALEGPVDAACPASVLQTHPDAHVLADPAATALLSR